MASKKQQDELVRALSEELQLKPCENQVAGHLFENGKAGSLVDQRGKFYKPVQQGPRGVREYEFYESLNNYWRRSLDLDEVDVSAQSSEGVTESDSIRFRRILSKFVPKYYGCYTLGESRLITLEDLCSGYLHPSVIDIKIGFRTWYSMADERYIERARAKDQATTQSELGFKICGLQIYNCLEKNYHREAKDRCKTMPVDTVKRTLAKFANNNAGLRPQDIYGGPQGVVSQLRELQRWFNNQTYYHLYSSSVLILYEGEAKSQEQAKVKVKLIDFAHTFGNMGSKDENYIAGLTALVKQLTNVMKQGKGDTLL
eukprot:TRINITY_DN97429_c0_g1_i3.p1 TRINITY_DN97429_c0_g1~~TRINITY_DN97429_c0_g1_i3.p1  ORF type:complete len:334 (+),score=31.30 TRINITY_DN97429_c0_g1_i3:61-1002(+)